jgi:chromosome segregation ATPase
MRWIGIALFVCCTQALLAQSLGDVARAQREAQDHPRAKRVITNADIDSRADAAPLEQPARPAAKAAVKPAADRSQPADSERALVQRRINELNQRVQSLQGEVSDLEKQRSSLRSSMIYGDPNRAQQNEEFSRLGRQIDAKNLELSAARNELSDALDRANKTTVLK